MDACLRGSPGAWQAKKTFLMKLLKFSLLAAALICQPITARAADDHKTTKQCLACCKTAEKCDACCKDMGKDCLKDCCKGKKKAK